MEADTFIDSRNASATASESDAEEAEEDLSQPPQGQNMFKGAAAKPPVVPQFTPPAPAKKGRPPGSKNKPKEPVVEPREDDDDVDLPAVLLAPAARPSQFRRGDKDPDTGLTEMYPTEPMDMDGPGSDTDMAENMVKATLDGRGRPLPKNGL